MLKVAYRREIVPAPICVTAGLLISVLPHLLSWSRGSGGDWIADLDNVFHLGLGGRAYVEHPTRLTDPAAVAEGPSIYKPLPLLPGILVARALRLGPVGIGVAWRALSGLTIGLAWYVLIRHWMRAPWLAAMLTLILLGDAGLIDGRLVVGQVAGLIRAAHPAPPPSDDPRDVIKFHAGWRVATPALTMTYLLICLWAIARGA